MDGALDLQRPRFLIEVLPFQTAKLTAAQADSQFRIEEVSPDLIPLDSFRKHVQLLIVEDLLGAVVRLGRHDPLRRVFGN
jgi:hypothetical protein